MEDLADAAPNEAEDVEQPNHSTKANPRSLQWKACQRPLRQNHVQGFEVRLIHLSTQSGPRRSLTSNPKLLGDRRRDRNLRGR